MPRLYRPSRSTAAPSGLICAPAHFRPTCGIQGGSCARCSSLRSHCTITWLQQRGHDACLVCPSEGARPARDSSGNHHAEHLRALCDLLHENPAETRLIMGGAVRGRGGVLHIPGSPRGVTTGVDYLRESEVAPASSKCPTVQMLLASGSRGKFDNAERFPEDPFIP